MIVSTPHRAASAGRHVHVRDQSKQGRQFMLCGMRDDHSEGEAGGSDVRKQVAAVLGRCWQREGVKVLLGFQLFPQLFFKSNQI